MHRVVLRFALVAVGILSLGVPAPTAQAGPIVRFDLNFSSGGISSFDIELFDTEAPITVANFLQYVNAGLYDNTIVHRNMEGFVTQGGGFTPVTSGGTVTALNPIPTFAPIQNEFSPTRSNLVGTVAMAKLGGDPNSATSQWFVNLGDNSANLDNQNGGFTVFGRVLGSGMTLINAIDALPTYDLSFTFGGAFTDVPKFNNGTSFVTVMKASLLAPPTPVGSLAGRVYLDANGNGAMDAADYAIAEAKVAAVENGTNKVLATVYSGPDGSYQFSNLVAGTYSIQMQTPVSIPGLDTSNSHTMLDKSGNPVGAGTALTNAYGGVTLGDGYTGQSYNFAEGVYPAALMSARMLLNTSAGVPHVNVPASTAAPSGGGASPVPEPGTLALLAAGGLALGAFAWRRRKTR